MPPRTPRLAVCAALLALLALLGAVLAVPAGASSPSSPSSPSSATDARPVAGEHLRPQVQQRADPRRSRGLFVDPLMPAANQGSRYARIGRTPQALWFGNEYYPADRVRQVARAYVQRAVRAGKTPMLVVYSIPDRDCGQYSGGGLPGAAAYRTWVSRLAAGVKGSKPIVILEPDALPFYGAGACGTAATRLGLIRYAVRRLAAAGAWVYIDAGHSNWTPYAGRAELLKKAGIQWARGFSTNVANYRTTAAEKKYAGYLLGQLRRLGVRGVHYVIDTSRNGARGGPQSADVYNPTWARVGAAPRLVFRGALDGTLWVKHPGESDGPVNTTASSGQWCDYLGDRLLGRTSVASSC